MRVIAGVQEDLSAAAALYLQKAKLGWQFLTNAIAKYGKNGAYQKITHYGDNFADNDELAWAACEMYLATGDQLHSPNALVLVRSRGSGHLALGLVAHVRMLRQRHSQLRLRRPERPRHRNQLDATFLANARPKSPPRAMTC